MEESRLKDFDIHSQLRMKGMGRNSGSNPSRGSTTKGTPLNVLCAKRNG